MAGCARPSDVMGRAVVLMMMMLGLASCSGHPDPGATAAGPPKDAGQLMITQITVGHVFPTEGARSYIRVESPAGAALAARQLPGSQKLVLPLEPGAYRLVSWQRTCDGNCGNLDPPSDRCARPFTVRPHQKLDVTIRVNFASGCVIVMSG
jgi:hypothetical protein